jgi:hypothetical protein
MRYRAVYLATYEEQIEAQKNPDWDFEDFWVEGELKALEEVEKELVDSGYEAKVKPGYEDEIWYEKADFSTSLGKRSAYIEPEEEE